MIDLDAMMQAQAADGWGQGAGDKGWFSPDTMVSQLKTIDARVQQERATLKRMWAAVAATPAGRHVLEHLMHEYVLKQSFDVHLAGSSLEALAMHGIWRDAQRHLVNTILGLAGSGAGQTPQQEQTHERHNGGGPDDAGGPGGNGGSGLRFGFADADGSGGPDDAGGPGSNGGGSDAASPGVRIP